MQHFHYRLLLVIQRRECLSSIDFHDWHIIGSQSMLMLVFLFVLVSGSSKSSLFIMINTYIRNQEGSQINLTLYLKEVEREEQTKH